MSATGDDTAVHRIEWLAIDKHNWSACFGYNEPTGCDVPWLQIFGGEAIDDTFRQIAKCHSSRAKRAMSTPHRETSQLWKCISWMFLHIFTQRYRMTICNSVSYFSHEWARLIALGFLDHRRPLSAIRSDDELSFKQNHVFVGCAIALPE